MSKSTFLGYDTGTNRPVEIGDLERRAATYLLGKPGMGKTNLLIQFALHDIEAGYGLFFLDPHGDAIKAIRMHGELPRLRQAIVLDPEIERFAFGINLTSCENVGSLTERVNTYTKAYNVFKRAFAEDWGPWLQLIIENTLYTFIENQEYTLAEAPRFLLNAEFRQKLVSNMQYNPEVIDFWRYRFSQRREREQEAQVDAALTRFSTFLGHPYIRDIIGQERTKVDFAAFMRERKIVFLRLSSNLAEDIKRFIGTILISELLHAVRRREEIPFEKRTHFSVFVDEFQNFATEDFADLITEGRKFGVATTIAHQERIGQLRENPKVLGATLACAIKILFQLTVRDAQELAPEFARPVEEKEGREPDLVVSPHALEDIWERGHPDTALMDIRAKYFWIARLARQHPAGEDIQQAFSYNSLPQFAPSRTIPQEHPFDPSRFSGLDFRKFPWAAYRTPPNILSQGIECLNRYYYQQMSGTGGTVLVSEVVQSLGGIFGFYPCQDGAIPSRKRTILEEFLLPVFTGRLENDHESFARKFYEYDASNWSNPIHYDWKPDTYVHPYNLPRVKQSRWDFYDRQNQALHLERSLWQVKQLVQFVREAYVQAAIILARDPIKIPSGRYTESVKVERTQQDLINEMALELSELSPYTAYTKLISLSSGTQQTTKNRVRTQKAPEGSLEATIPLSECYTSRTEVNRRIAQRLGTNGRRPGSRPPPRSS